MVMADGKTLDGSGTIVTKLHEAIEKNARITQPCLDKRTEILTEYSNGFYSEGQRTRCPMNLVSRAITLLLPLLASQDPKAMTRARVVQLAPYAETLRLTLNHLIGKIKLGETLRAGILDALTYMGIFKTGICPGGSEIKDAFGVTHDSGQIFCDIIYPEDYFFDTTARRRDEADFEGNWFYVPFDYITDSGLYKNYDKMVDGYSEWDKNSPKKISEGGSKHIGGTLKPYCKVAEVYIPSENILMTMPPKGMGTEPLRVVDYNGPVLGPYDTLSFMPFPESIIPIAPLYTNLDLHYLINIMTRKMARQANRERKVLAYQGNASDDATNIKNTADGGSVKVDDINAIKELEYGGTAEASYTWVQWLQGVWSEQMGNANLISGLKADSPTLGQEQMLLANASAGIEDMSAAVHNVTKSIMHKMAYYVFTDPLMDVSISKRIGGVGEIPVRVTADTREGDFWDYNFEVVPYSMQRMNPNVRMRKLIEITTAVILPTMQMATQQGATLNIPKLVKSITRDQDLTDGEIDEIYQSVTTVNNDLGPYQPSKGTIKGVGDQLGASDASRNLNSVQQQTREGSNSSRPQNTNNI